MKKQISLVPNRPTNFLRSVVLISALVLSSAPALVAQASLNPVPRVTVQHAVPIAGFPVFSVLIEKEASGSFDLYISDEEGTVLYTERIKGQHYAKRFQLDVKDLEAMKLVVKVVGKNARDTQTFHVNRTLSVVEDMVVSKQ